jgi:hypothetical protein
MAVAGGLTLITFDKGSGSLAFRVRLPARCGIVLFRIRKRSEAHVVDLLRSTLRGEGPWTGNFSVVDDIGFVRQRPLPT